MSNVIQFPQGGRRVEIGQRYECIKTIRDGVQAAVQDGSQGYPEFEPGQQIEISETYDAGYGLRFIVMTPRGDRIGGYTEQKLRDYFKRIR